MERMENSINPLRGLIECQRRPVNEVQHNISRVIIESRIGENGGSWITDDRVSELQNLEHSPRCLS